MNSDDSLRLPDDPDMSSTADLPYLVWNLCDQLFASLGDEFRGPIEGYLEAYLQPRLEAALGQSGPNLPSQFTKKQQESAIRSISDRLATAADLTVGHFRSRRGRSESSWAWRRALTGQLTTRGTVHQQAFNGWDLPRHVFESAPEAGALLIRFEQGDDFETAGDDTELVVGATEWRVLAETMAHVSERLPPRRIERDDTEKAMMKIPPARRESLLLRLAQHYPTRGLESSERLALLMESCFITLRLLSRGDLQPPRAVLLVPVLIGSERVGGMSFSGEYDRLRPNVRDLIQYSRNLLSYIAIRESHEIEVDKRLLDELTPVAHLFIHTFNKAFVTPVLNIADEVDSISAGLLGESAASQSIDDAERLHSTAVYLRSYARRWAGTFPALQVMATPKAEPVRFVRAQHRQLRGGEILQHLEAIYALTMANDVFDDAELVSYRHLLSASGGLARIVSLKVDLPHAVPGHPDIWALHLLSLLQNSLEALPLYDSLVRAREAPEQASTPLELSLRSQLDRESRSVVVMVTDNGRGFDSEILQSQKRILQQFSRVDGMRPSLTEVHRRVRTRPGEYSSKGAESFGFGLVGCADYLARICRIRLGSASTRQDDWFVEGEIVQRGKVDIVPNELGPGTTLCLTVPVDDYTEAAGDATVVVVERP